MPKFGMRMCWQMT